MNSIRLIQFGAVSLLGLFFTQADEGLLTKAMKNSPSGAIDKSSLEKSTIQPTSRNTAPLQGIELRVGPIYNTQNSFDIQSGPRGQGFDLKKLGIDDPSYGIKADVDWEMGPGLHFNNALTWIHFNQAGNLESDVTFGTGIKLKQGSRVEADLNIIKYEPKIGYDVVKLDDFRLMPYVGAIAGISTGNVSAKSGFVEREQGKLSRIDREKVYNTTEFFGTYLLGFELQYRFTKGFYTGFDLGGYYMGFLNGASGKGYLAYDFTEKLSMRLGCDVDWVSYDLRRVTVEGHTTTPYLQMGVKF